MKTTEEIFGQYFNGMHYNDITSELIIKYAKRYAQEALKEAAEKAITKTNDERTSIVVDKESILNIELI